MPLITNNSGEFPGALTIIEPPIGAGDCTNFDTFEELCSEECVASRGCTIRSGKAWATRAVGDIETDCEAV